MLVTRSIEGAPLIHHIVKHGFDNLDPVVPEQIGRYMTRLHSIKTDGCGLFAMTQAGIFPGAWLKYFPIVTKAFFQETEGKGLLDDGVLGEIRAIFETHYKIGLLGEVVALAHNQYSPLNLWFDENLKKMTGVVNWERSGSGTTFSDFITWKLWCWDDGFFSDIMKGYEKLKAKPDKFEEKLHFYTMINGLQMAAHSAKLGNENNKNYFIRQALMGASHYGRNPEGQSGQTGFVYSHDLPRLAFFNRLGAPGPLPRRSGNNVFTSRSEHRVRRLCRTGLFHPPSPLHAPRRIRWTGRCSLPPIFEPIQSASEDPTNSA